MKKVKITVIKCGLNQKLIDKYVQGNIDPCSYNIEGITFISNGWQKPFGLCDNAWNLEINDGICFYTFTWRWELL